GADRGVLLQTDRIPADGLEVAKALAAELTNGGYDLVLFGRMAIDDYNHQVGPMVAELLDLPCVTAVAHLDIAGQRGSAEREIEGGVEIVEFPLPAVLTTDKGLNEPRYPALKGIMAAKKKPLEVKPTTPAAGGLEVVAMTPPPQRKEGKVVGEGPAAGVEALVVAAGPVQGADQLGGFGADKVITLANPAFGRYAPEGYARVIADRARAGGYRAVVFAASAAGRDLAPRVAARLGVALAQDITDVTVEGGDRKSTRLNSSH